MTDLFGTWLDETAALQREAYGNEPGGWSFPRWIEYVRNQTLAAFVELGEFIQELEWKPWSAKADNWWPDAEERARAIEELVDVLHFVANDLYALGVTTEELNEVYTAKMTKNRQRMASGGH